MIKKIQFAAIIALILSNNLIGLLIIDAFSTGYNLILSRSEIPMLAATAALLITHLYNRHNERKKEEERLEGYKKGHKGPKRSR